jgi:mscS mechanosensitive ion channel
MLKMKSIEFDIMQIVLPIVYILIGMIIYKLLKRIIDKSINVSKITLNSHKQRAQTIKMLILNIIKYITVILVTLAILSTYGINVKSILAGLGITTAIIGLAFQDLAKDLIAGIAIITENQYEVGDTIEVDGFMGEVVFLGLKTTKIRDFKGATKIVSNHNMDKIINYSLHDSLALIDIGASYDNTPEEVEKVLQELITSLNGKIPNVTGDIQLLGINKLGNSSVEYRITAPTKPMQHYAVERILRKEIKNAFDKAKINIPYPQVEVHNGK